MERIKGIDVSNWNSNQVLEDWLNNEEKHACHFVFIKATEGRTWVDETAAEKLRICQDHFQWVGFYHFCRPDNGNTPEEEMDNFIGTVNTLIRQQGLNEEVALVLDWEPSQPCNTKWLQNAVKIIQERCGVNPIIYCSQSMIQVIGPSLNVNDVGLWVADWSHTEMTSTMIAPWNVWAFWQHTQSPIDQNVFNGTVHQMVEYFKYRPLDKTEQNCNCQCMCCKLK